MKFTLNKLILAMQSVLLLLLAFLPVSTLTQGSEDSNISVRYNYPASSQTNYTVNLMQNKLVQLAGPHFPGKISIHLQLDKTMDNRLGKEGYLVKSAPKDISITATTENGVLYGSIALLEWIIAKTTTGVKSPANVDIDFMIVPGQARKFLQQLPQEQFESKPFYPIRFFHLNNYAMGVSDLIDSEVLLHKNNFHSGVDRGFDDAENTWKEWCDWLSRHRINRVSNWPYAAGTNWWDLAVTPETVGMSKYPQNEIFKAAKIREEWFKYAQSRGVRPYLMNYLTGAATPTIAKNYPGLIGKLDMDDKDHHGAISYCYANDGLEKIFTAQIKAILQTYPSLAGIHIRWWGESFPCQCSHCKGRQGELQRKLTLVLINAAMQDRPEIELLLSGRLFLHGRPEFWAALPKNVVVQTKWGIDWEPTADPNLDYEDIVKTGHPFLISEALPCEEVTPLGTVQYLPYRDGLLKYAKNAQKAPNVKGFSIAVADKDFGWITETNFMTAAKLNWAPFKVDVEAFVGNYLRTTYGDAQEDIYKALELSQKAWQEYSVDFDGVALYKDYNQIAWMHGIDSVNIADPKILQQNIKRIEKHSQMLTQSLFILERARFKVTPHSLVPFDDMAIMIEAFAEFFTSRQLLAEAFNHRNNKEHEKMRNKLRMVNESTKRLITLVQSKPNYTDYFEMEGMTQPTNYTRGSIYISTPAAWDYLQNRVFEEMEVLKEMINKSEIENHGKDN
jgi:hypothetical protein